MPRDGSGIYTTPAGTTAVPDTTIESAKYNANVADVAADLNAARPIIAGGTGATSATAARTNLQAEVAAKEVTNYDTHVFEAGSFFSAPGATAEPIPGGGWYTYGICMRATDGAMQLDAWVSQGGASAQHWTRTRWGSWLPWVKQAGSEADFVNTTGDTMTGDLVISKASPTINLTKSASGQGIVIAGTLNGPPRWWVRPGNDEAETGSNAGSNFDILRWSDAGAFLGGAFSINRANGEVNVNGNLKAGNFVMCGAGSATDGIVYFNNTTTKYLQYTGGVFQLVGGTLNTTLGIGAGFDITVTQAASGSPDKGSLLFGNTGSKYLHYDGANFILNGGQLSISSGLAVQGALYGTTTMQVSAAGAGDASMWFANNASAGRGMLRWEHTSNALELLHVDASYAGIQLGPDGRVAVGKAIKCRAGINGILPGYDFNLNWTSAVLDCWIGATNIGYLQHTSDYRIKKDVIDLPSSWEAVRALRPVKYTQANYTAPAEIEARAKEALRIKLMNEEKRAKGEEEIDTKPAVSGHTFVADDVERWGFVAHELQETLIASAATGTKDDPVNVQAPNQWTVIAALTKALQEAMARIEALEAAASVPVR
jgi:hypothetical protein